MQTMAFAFKLNSHAGSRWHSLCPGDYAKTMQTMPLGDSLTGRLCPKASLKGSRLTTSLNAFQSVELCTVPRLVRVYQFEATVDSPNLFSE